MTNQTRSEDLFESFCKENDLTVNRIEPGGYEGVKTPDYELVIGNQTVVVEVKQIDPNPEDRVYDTQLKARGYTDVMTDEPGHRIRGKITDAMPQLKSKCKGKFPGILVLFTNIASKPWIEPYDILTGMYGLEVIRLPIADGVANTTDNISIGFGGKRKVTHEHNTTLSAVGAMAVTAERIFVHFYHNIFAKNPLDPNILRLPHVKHFTLEKDADGRRFHNWVEE